MKIVITITSNEISQLIQQHLAKENIQVNIEDIKYSKGQAVVTADAPMEFRPDAPAPPAYAEHAAVPAPATEPTPAPPPALEVVDGGQVNADMGDVFAASRMLATTTEGKFPAPKHAMLPGESHEYPGDK